MAGTPLAQIFATVRFSLGIRNGQVIKGSYDGLPGRDTIPYPPQEISASAPITREKQCVCVYSRCRDTSGV